MPLIGLIGEGLYSAIQPNQFDNKFQLAHLNGKLANIITEINSGGSIPDGKLKKLTSGEPLTVENKFKNPFEMQPFATLIFATNELPKTKDFTNGVTRRAVVIHFNRVFTGAEQDAELSNKLLTELPGILNLSLQAIAQVIKRSRNKPADAPADWSPFTLPKSVREAGAMWKIDQNPVAQFIQDACVLEPESRTPMVELWQAYKVWELESGLPVRQRLKRTDAAKQFIALAGGQTTKSGRVVSVCGIRLL